MYWMANIIANPIENRIHFLIEQRNYNQSLFVFAGLNAYFKALNVYGSLVRRICFRQYERRNQLFLVLVFNVHIMFLGY